MRVHASSHASLGRLAAAVAGRAATCRRVAKFEYRHLVGDDGRAFVTYELTKTNGERFCNAEILSTRNGKVTDVEVYFGWMIPHEAPAGGFVDRPD
ncbi:MAG: hypothetical protein ACREVI_03560 [Steroidobacteraceae bacterium]